MIINKNIGHWSNDSTLLDDYAYQLYINYMIDTYVSDVSDVSMGPQSNFIKSYYKFNEKCVAYPFYKKANLIIRKEKLLNLPQ